MTADLLELKPPSQQETPVSPTSPDFDWCHDCEVLIETQPATAIYVNRGGHVVIRQQDPAFEDDPFVAIAPEYLGRVIARLTELRDAHRAVTE